MASKKSTQPSPVQFAVSLDNPHAGSFRRWLNINADYSQASLSEYCTTLANDAERIVDRTSCVCPKVVSENGKPGLFISHTYDAPGLLKHCILPLGETVDQWRRRIADVASRHTIYGPG